MHRLAACTGKLLHNYQRLHCIIYCKTHGYSLPNFACSASLVHGVTEQKDALQIKATSDCTRKLSLHAQSCHSASDSSSIPSASLSCAFCISYAGTIIICIKTHGQRCLSLLFICLLHLLRKLFRLLKLFHKRQVAEHKHQIIGTLRCQLVALLGVPEVICNPAALASACTRRHWCHFCLWCHSVSYPAATRLWIDNDQRWQHHQEQDSAMLTAMQCDAMQQALP